MNSLVQWDIKLFLYLNSLHVDWMDPIMIGFSDKFIWIPFYLVLLVVLYRKYEIKSVLTVVLLVVGVVLAADQGSVHLFKNVFQRLRPCHNESINSSIYLLKHCGGQYGFVSSHATNTFAIAIFLGSVLQSKWLIGLLIWASIVSYSRIYLGVHFPLDIVGGAILGAIIALVFLQVQSRFNLNLKEHE